MTSEPIIRSLSDWAEQRITALYSANTKEQFEEAFNAFVSKHAEITLNGKKTSRSKFEEELWDAQADKRSASVKYLGTVDIPKDATEPLDGGEVGLFAESTIDLKTVIIGKPTQRIVSASYNFVFAEDKTIEWPGGGPGPVVPPGFFTRATVVSCVSVTQPGKIIPLTFEGN